jgi:hypothetical protein
VDRGRRQPRTLLEKGRRRVAAASDGRRRRVPKEGGDGGSGRQRRRARECANGADGGKTHAEGVSNPRFGAREEDADLGKLNFAYHKFGAREDGAKLATSDFLGPLPCGSAPGRYGADMHDFGADRDGVERRGQTPK